MMAGMFILIWSSTGGLTTTALGGSWWNGEAKLAVTFTIVAVTIACFLVMEQVALYSFLGKDDSAAA